jgi:hypothetical protein
MYKNLFLKIVLSLSVISSNVKAQPYPPIVGQPGSTAIYKDSSAFVNWVTSCNVVRGLQDVSTPTLGLANGGDSSMVIGIAGTNGVVSLGDGGSAICTFQYPIKNGIGNDFAVFENSFDDTFLELAFVEVSSDGINFVRFPSHSLTDTTLQTNTFGTTDATKINNLAGKYRSSYGTPFDLQELSSNPILNINYITHVKIIDVVGSVNKQYAKRDSYNNMINDPWPTPFPNGGFDLDAIGVIHQNTSVGLKENNLDDNLYLYPNPINKGEKLLLSTSKDILFVSVYNFSGQKILSTKENFISTSELTEGIYFIEINSVNNSITKKLLIK